MASSLEGWRAPCRLPIQHAAACSGYAGTSSFGMSGVNAHAIIQAVPSDLHLPNSESTSSGTRWMRQNFQAPLFPVGHPLLHVASRPSKAVTEFRLPTNRWNLAYLLDHRVQGKALFPGAGAPHTGIVVPARLCLFILFVPRIDPNFI